MTIDDYNKAVEEHADGIYRFILKNCRNEELAQDVVQESFEKLWVKLDNVDGGKAQGSFPVFIEYGLIKMAPESACHISGTNPDAFLAICPGRY